jgi:hypothetical protein
MNRRISGQLLKMAGLAACVLLGLAPHLLVRIGTASGETWMTRWKFREQTQIMRDHLSRDQMLGMDYQLTRYADWTFRPVRLASMVRFPEGGRQTFIDDDFLVAIPSKMTREPRPELVRAARDIHRRWCSASAANLTLEDLKYLGRPDDFIITDTLAPGYADSFVEILRSGVPSPFETTVFRGEFPKPCVKVFWYLEAASRVSDFACSPLCASDLSASDDRWYPFCNSRISRMRYMDYAAYAAAESKCPDCIERVRYFLARRSAYPLHPGVAERIIERRIRGAFEAK